MNQVAPKHPCLRRLSLPAGLDSRLNAAGIKQPIQASGARRREDGSPRGPRHVVARFTTSVREAARPSGHGELRALPSDPRTLEASFLLEGASMNQWQSLYSSCERAPMKDRTHKDSSHSTGGRYLQAVFPEQWLLLLLMNGKFVISSQ